MTGRRAAPSAIAALVEVMREQTRVREGGASRAAAPRRARAPAARPATLIAALRAHRAPRAPAQREPVPAGGTTHISGLDADGNAASLSSSTGSGSGVVVPGTGIHLNNMLGEYDLVAGRAAPARARG